MFAFICQKFQLLFEYITSNKSTFYDFLLGFFVGRMDLNIFVVEISFPHFYILNFFRRTTKLYFGVPNCGNIHSLQIHNSNRFVISNPMKILQLIRSVPSWMRILRNCFSLHARNIQIYYFVCQPFFCLRDLLPHVLCHSSLL